MEEIEECKKKNVNNKKYKLFNKNKRIRKYNKSVTIMPTE